MERYLYFGGAGVDFEGEGVTSVHTTLEAAKAFVEADCRKNSYSDNFFFATLWDTQKQTQVYRWDFNKETLAWESWGQMVIKNMVEEQI